MVFSGHRTRSVFERYNIVSGRDLEDAASKMERRHNKALGTVTGTVAEKVGEDENREVVENRSKLLN